MKTVKLISGHEMPVLGLGTWTLRGQECRRVIKTALELGYTHIDTAWMYDNQEAIGEALREIDAPREKLFITSKIWRTHLKYNDVLAQCDESLGQLQMDYVDLLLIHWPNDAVPLQETLDAFKKIHDDGKAKSIGISNFSVEQVNQAKRISQVPINVNQVEYHVGRNREELLQHCQQSNIVVTAHRPLAKGEITQHPTLKSIGEKHGKTSGQVGLRWLLQKNIVAIPKSSSEVHLKENLDVFDWELTPDEMEQINRT